MERLQRMFQNAQAGMGAEPGQDNPTADNSEMVYISSLSLLKVNRADRTFGMAIYNGKLDAQV